MANMVAYFNYFLCFPSTILSKEQKDKSLYIGLLLVFIEGLFLYLKRLKFSNSIYPLTLFTRLSKPTYNLS